MKDKILWFISFISILFLILFVFFVIVCRYITNKSSRKAQEQQAKRKAQGVGQLRGGSAIPSSSLPPSSVQITTTHRNYLQTCRQFVKMYSRDLDMTLSQEMEDILSHNEMVFATVDKQRAFDLYLVKNQILLVLWMLKLYCTYEVDSERSDYVKVEPPVITAGGGTLADVEDIEQDDEDFSMSKVDCVEKINEKLTRMDPQCSSDLNEQDKQVLYKSLIYLLSQWYNEINISLFQQIQGKIITELGVGIDKINIDDVLDPIKHAIESISPNIFIEREDFTKIVNTFLTEKSQQQKVEKLKTCLQRMFESKEMRHVLDTMKQKQVDIYLNTRFQHEVLPSILLSLCSISFKDASVYINSLYSKKTHSNVAHTLSNYVCGIWNYRLFDENLDIMSIYEIEFLKKQLPRPTILQSLNTKKYVIIGTEAPQRTLEQDVVEMFNTIDKIRPNWEHVFYCFPINTPENPSFFQWVKTTAMRYFKNLAGHWIICHFKKETTNMKLRIIDSQDGHNVTQTLKKNVEKHIKQTDLSYKYCNFQLGSNSCGWYIIFEVFRLISLQDPWDFNCETPPVFLKDIINDSVHD